MVEQEEQSLGEELIRALVGFPKYAIQWVGGLVVAVLTDLHMTAITVTAVLLGVAIGSVIWGVTGFFLIYSLSRVVGNLANSVGFGLQDVASKLYTAAYLLSDKDQ